MTNAAIERKPEVAAPAAAEPAPEADEPVEVLGSVAFGDGLVATFSDDYIWRCPEAPAVALDLNATCRDEPHFSGPGVAAIAAAAKLLDGVPTFPPPIPHRGGDWRD